MRRKQRFNFKKKQRFNFKRKQRFEFRGAAAHLHFLLGFFDLRKDGLEGAYIAEDLVHWCFASLG